MALGALLRKLREEGVTILIVEHDMDFVMKLVDRSVVMNFGSNAGPKAWKEIWGCGQGIGAIDAVVPAAAVAARAQVRADRADPIPCFCRFESDRAGLWARVVVCGRCLFRRGELAIQR